MLTCWVAYPIKLTVIKEGFPFNGNVNLPSSRVVVPLTADSLIVAPARGLFKESMTVPEIRLFCARSIEGSSSSNSTVGRLQHSLSLCLNRLFAVFISSKILL